MKRLVLSSQGHYTVGLLEELDSHSVQRTVDFDLTPVDAESFLDPSKENTTGLDFIDNAYLVDREQWYYDQSRPHTELCPQRVVQVSCCGAYMKHGQCQRHVECGNVFHDDAHLFS